MTTDSEPTLEVAVLLPGFPGVLSHSPLYETTLNVFGSWIRLLLGSNLFVCH